MYNVVKQMKCSFIVWTTLIIIVITTRVRAVSFKTCAPEELASCGKSLSMLTNTGLTLVKSKDDLDMVCPDWNKSLSCIHAYSRLCMSFHQRKHFRKLFHDTGSMVHDLCRNGTYQDEFLSHAPCMQKVSNETELCFNNYSEAMMQIETSMNKQKEMEEGAYRNNHHHHNQRSKSHEIVFRYQKAKREVVHGALKIVCCSYREYVNCSAEAVRKMCGDDAAQFRKGFLDKIASSMLKIHCMVFSANDCRDKISKGEVSKMKEFINQIIKRFHIHNDNKQM